MENKLEQPTLRSSRVRRWFGHLRREWTIESLRPIAPAFAKPEPLKWSDAKVTTAWIGHATVLINFFGIKILTDPALFPRIGIRLPGFTIGPKRLTAPALEFHELPKIDIVLLSHAHFDHFDLRTLSRLDKDTRVITAPRTRTLLRWTRLREITELRWNERKSIETSAGEIDIVAFPVNHWARDASGILTAVTTAIFWREIIAAFFFAGDTALTNSFADLRKHGRIDLAIMSIGAYNPWIRSHSTAEQAIDMANAAGVQFIMPVHHQTFRLSFEPFREPIERFEAALRTQPERIALREIGETFVLPL
jgi:L-ascorbate metabolism protein UlaG (beta-lactamase superfamily)